MNRTDGTPDPAQLAFEVAKRDGPPSLSVWRHRKGGVYVVVGRCVIEAGLTPAVVYSPALDFGPHRQWVRPLSEFLDGRFVKLAGDVADYSRTPDGQRVG